jgi:hypothetical protein
MANHVSTEIAVLTLTGSRNRLIVAAIPIMVVALTCAAQNVAQEPVQQNSDNHSQAAPSPTGEAVTIPAGTRFALVLTNPVASKSIRRGDEIYTQTVAPIVVGDQVVIPPGTFVQGKLDKLSRHGSRAEIRLQSASVVFPNGFVANAVGPTDVQGEEGTAWQVAGGGNVAGAIVAPLAGLGLGTLIGHAAGGKGTDINGMNFNPGGLKSTAIGGMVGLAAGGVVSFIFLTHNRHFFVDVGSPMQMTLAQPLTLAQGPVSDALRDAQAHPATPMPVAKRPPPPPVPATASTGTCYKPDTPSTPPTVIAGTPAIGNAPGTPDIIIPGTPSIPGTPYPCP